MYKNAQRSKTNKGIQELTQLKNEMLRREKILFLTTALQFATHVRFVRRKSYCSAETIVLKSDYVQLRLKNICMP